MEVKWDRGPGGRLPRTGRQRGRSSPGLNEGQASREPDDDPLGSARRGRPRRPRLVPAEPAERPSLLVWLEDRPDPRQGPAWHDRISAVLAWQVSARASGWPGGPDTEAFAQALPRKDLETRVCPFNRRTQRYETLGHDLPAGRGAWGVERPETGGATLEDPRCPRPQALAGDSERIDGANRRNPEGAFWETVSLVDHSSGLPVASPQCPFRPRVRRLRQRLGA